MSVFRLLLSLIILSTISPSLYSEEPQKRKVMGQDIVEAPKYLYKILSTKQWQATQRMKAVQLSTRR